ncbi:kynurenine 3-monooxygenase [Saccharomycopsis crataegensis]|uniref:Kynurenine 3-monooxygenase n=1 Tax=Saccharomycopsis crataegensis TaxID=43959 RepID=A0AAV5QUL6_9ASCO|nr:kynurenine 3-monooxygenase [Saccharomycopsis crataegensis]
MSKILIDEPEPRKEKVAIVGAGLVGCLAALSFARLGYKVTLYEYRDDPRNETTVDRNLRSINLAVSDRGIRALNAVDLEMSIRVLKNILPMRGRMIHDVDGHQTSMKYGLHNEAINSIDRAYLNIELLNELDRHKNIKVNYGLKLMKMDFSGKNGNPRIYFEKTKKVANTLEENAIRTFEYNFVIGADGAYSATRFQLQKFVRMDFSQEYMDCCYIELYIPPGASKKYKFQLHPNRLHIWPRNKFMLIALPNFDGSFTSTFFGPWDLTESLDTREKVIDFFQTNFKDAVDLIGLEQVVEAFLTHPKCSLVCTSCFPYNYKGKCIIVGDAAHSMVPFYGQGMNCGFEDVRVLVELVKKHEYELESAFNEYSVTRQQDLDAIITLARNNYTEMSHNVNTTRYAVRKKMDAAMHLIFGDKWLPLYTMVSFRGDIRYSDCIKRSKVQGWLLSQLELGVYGLGAWLAFKAIRAVVRDR